MSEQPEETPDETAQDEAPAVVVQAGLASAAAAAPDLGGEPETVPDPEDEG